MNDEEDFEFDPDFIDETRALMLASERNPDLAFSPDPNEDYGAFYPMGEEW